MTQLWKKYLELAGALQGKKVVLKDSPTPTVVEDQKLSPMGAPAAAGPCIFCPWCKHAFPEEGADRGTDGIPNKQSKSAAKKNSSTPSAPEAEGGVLQSIAASILMKVLYAARMARFDLLYAVNRLSCYITKWTPLCDRRLHKIMCYIQATKAYRMVGYVGDPMKDIEPHVYADADLAGCAATQRSTTGIQAQLEGPHTCFPICGISKRQGCVSSSTPEAEMVAGHHAFNKVIIPQLDLWQHLFGPTCKAVFHEDNESMIQVIRTGRNPTMRQLGRVHRVAIAVLHERLSGHGKDISLVHTASELMAADIYTKAFANPESWAKALDNINVFPKGQVEKRIRSKIKQAGSKPHDSGIVDLTKTDNSPDGVDYDTEIPVVSTSQSKRGAVEAPGGVQVPGGTDEGKASLLPVLSKSIARNEVDKCRDR